jgi:hypothetical protein
MAVIAAAFVSIARPSFAIPRFAARNSMECIQCHYDPTGGGVRNRYGADVYARTLLSIQGSEPTISPEGSVGEDGWAPEFSGMLTDWLTLGADVRLGYLLAIPEHGPMPNTDPSITSTLFLMQADLYHAATINPHVNLVLDVGVYTGFEAWLLIKAISAPTPYNLMIKAGRFKPAFGVRESNHTIFTRETVGFGPMDQDTGVELTAYLWNLTLNTAIVNGTLGTSFFDTFGTERRTFEKAVASRLSLRLPFETVRLQFGGSLYWNNNVDRQNPIFNPVVPMSAMTEVALGLDELRADGFAMANLGRFSYIADIVFVRDDFHSSMLSRLRAYSSYQELSFLPFQGLDLVATFETMNANLDAKGFAAVRAGFVVELFPFAYSALRLMIRELFASDPNPNVTDVVLFLHAFL